MKEPSSYGPDPLLLVYWSLICSFPAVAAGYDLLTIPTHDNLVEFAWLLAFPVLPMMFASRFRVTFGATEFVYRRWGKTIRVPYSDIARIEVANVTPLAKQPIGAFVVTIRGQRLPFWPKLFPRAAVQRFLALAR